jgi:hypothetical protein
MWDAPRFRPSGYCGRLLQVFYFVRSERLLMEQLNYNSVQLVRGLEINDGTARHSSKNRDGGDGTAERYTAL